jgi:hypothetical protein
MKIELNETCGFIAAALAAGWAIASMASCEATAKIEHTRQAEIELREKQWAAPKETP